MLVREAIERFERGLIGQGASKNTVSTYKRHLNRFVGLLGEKQIEEIGNADLNEFLYSVRLKEDGTEKTPRTMNSIKTALKSLFKSLNLKEDPAKRIRMGAPLILRPHAALFETLTSCLY